MSSERRDGPGSARGRTVRFGAGLVALCLPLLGFASLSSCELMRKILPSAGPAPRPFDHKAHIERGPDCLICHEGGETEVRAGMPTRESCWLCHEELDQDPAKPLEKKVAWFEDENKEIQWSAFTKQPDDIIFSHKVHAEKLIACDACHTGMKEDSGLRPGLMQRMSACVSCHEKQAPGKNDCATCHKTIRRNVAPPNHHLAWDNRHGVCARQGGEVSTGYTCALCHRQDECTTCHQNQPPDDHNAFWRLRSHGVASTIDRRRCQTCHASDFCVRCHQETSPVSHRAGWTAPTNRHCVSCHEPLQASGSCFVCHKSAPGHASATLMPVWHTPTMNCRSCHAASMRHPDSGGSCTYCHQ